jgi:hypothetical protein
LKIVEINEAVAKPKRFFLAYILLKTLVEDGACEWHKTAIKGFSIDDWRLNRFSIAEDKGGSSEQEVGAASDC